MTQSAHANTESRTSDATSRSETENKGQTAASQSGRTERSIKAALASSTRHSSDMLRQSGIAGAEATCMGTQVGTEAAQRSTHILAAGYRQFLEQSAEQLETIGRHMAQNLQENAFVVGGLVSLPAVAPESPRDLQEGFAGIVSSVVQSNVRATQELLRLTDPVATFDLQRRFMHDYLDAMMQGVGVFIRTARQTTEQTLRPIEARIDHYQQHQNRRWNEDHTVVGDVMSSSVRLANPEDSVQQATQLMRDEDTGVLPVGEGGRLVGIVTDRDVAFRLVAEGKDPARTKVREVMTQEVKYVFEDEDVGHVADNMAEQQVRRLPVVNRDKRLVGVISLGDLERGNRSGHYTGRAMRGVARASGQQMPTAAE